MPKKNGRKAGGKGGDSCFLPFHTFLPVVLTGGGLSSFALSPNANVSARSLVEADCWAHWRVRNFAFRLHPVAATSTTTQLAGFCGGVEDTTPATVAAIGELLPSVVMTADQTIPSEWVRPSKGELSGPLPWYKTILGTADATEESPGTLCFIGGLTEILNLEMRGIFEFKTAVATANTPMARNAIIMLREERVRGVVARERDLLLKILAAPQVTKTGS